MMDIILNTIPKSNNNSVLVVSCNVEFESHRNELFILYNIKNKKDYISLNIKYLYMVTLPYLTELRLLDYLDIW